MLKLYLSDMEFFDEEKEIFKVEKAKTLKLEHSLCSISKWEMKYEIPFMEHQMSPDELLYYIKCMSVDEELTDSDVKRINPEQMKSIADYINAKATATTFHQWGNRETGKKEVITSELIYYWMVSLEIPFECEHWHLNRLLTLIRVCGIKNNPKKMSKMDTMRSNSKLNAMRRKAMGSKG